MHWSLGEGESFRDPNRETDFGFVFVNVSCVRAKLCAMIPLWLGAAKLCSTPAPAVGGRTSRDVPWDVPGRPPANRSSRRRRKKFGGPQPQRNHRAQLRSHARHVHEAETEIDFPVGVPKGLTPQPPIYIYIYTYKTTLRAIRRLWGVGVQRFATSDQTSISHRTHSLSCRSCIGISSTSQTPRINITLASQRYRMDITSVSQQ